MRARTLRLRRSRPHTHCQGARHSTWLGARCTHARTSGGGRALTNPNADRSTHGARDVRATTNSHTKTNHTHEPDGRRMHATCVAPSRSHVCRATSAMRGALHSGHQQNRASPGKRTGAETTQLSAQKKCVRERARARGRSWLCVAMCEQCTRMAI